VKEEKVTRDKMVGDLPTLLDKIQDDLHTRNPDPDAMLFAKSYLAKALSFNIYHGLHSLKPSLLKFLRSLMFLYF
jgi:hypothetical protein